MAYQATVNFIRDICNDINPTGTFCHARRSDGSLEYHGEMPQIHLYPITSDIDVANGLISTSAILMAFWFQDATDSSNEEREAIIAKAEVLCNKFIQEAVEAEGFEITNIRTEPNYRQLAGTLSGYLLSFRLKTAESPC